MADYRLIINEGLDRLGFDFEPDRETVRAANPASAAEEELPTRRLFEIHLALNTLCVFPISTIPSWRFLRPKYRQIRSICVDLPRTYPLPAGKEEAHAFLRSHLPSGFIFDPGFGLGVMKEMKPLITAIEKIPAVRYFAIENRGRTGVDGDRFVLNRGDYEDIRLAFQRISRNYQAESLADRNVLAHNEILHRLDPRAFPPVERPYRPGTVFKLLGGRGARAVALRGRDRKGLVDAVAGNARHIAEHDPAEFVQLQKDIELVSLDRLIEAFRKKLRRNEKESAWQTLFELNPFILSMVFGYPVVLVASGASLGGASVHGPGNKIADFLMKNQGTHNAALVEIKRPDTELFAKEYSTGVWSPSAALTSGIVQVLDQREKLLTNLAAIKHASDLGDLQAHSVDCVLVIGRMPDARPKRASLELFRSSLQGVRLITFDELLGKIELLRELISGKRYEAADGDDDEDMDVTGGAPAVGAGLDEEEEAEQDPDEYW